MRLLFCEQKTALIVSRKFLIETHPIWQIPPEEKPLSEASFSSVLTSKRTAGAEARELAITQLRSSSTPKRKCKFWESDAAGRVKKARRGAAAADLLTCRVQPESGSTGRGVVGGAEPGCECVSSARRGCEYVPCSAAYVRTRADAVGGARPKSILPGTTEGGIPESINPATRFAPCSCTRALTLSHQEGTQRAPRSHSRKCLRPAGALVLARPLALEDAPCSIVRRFAHSRCPRRKLMHIISQFIYTKSISIFDKKIDH